MHALHSSPTTICGFSCCWKQPLSLLMSEAHYFHFWRNQQVFSDSCLYGLSSLRVLGRQGFSYKLTERHREINFLWSTGFTVGTAVCCDHPKSRSFPLLRRCRDTWANHKGQTLMLHGNNESTNLSSFDLGLKYVRPVPPKCQMSLNLGTESKRAEGSPASGKSVSYWAGEGWRWSIHLKCAM